MQHSIFPVITSAWTKESNESISLHNTRPTVTSKKGNLCQIDCARLYKLCRENNICIFVIFNSIGVRSVITAPTSNSSHVCFPHAPRTSAESEHHFLCWTESSVQLRSTGADHFHLKTTHRVLLHLLWTGAFSSFTGFLCCEFVPEGHTVDMWNLL